MTRIPKVTRRTVLQGLGTALALPLLDIMAPSLSAATAGKPPVRMGFIYVPNGINMNEWTPEKTGTDFELPATLKPLEKYKKDLLVLSGLTLNGGRALGDGAGDHARSVASFLTGAHPKKTSGADINNGPSVDQIGAREIGEQTKLPSLELGLERSAPAGTCDSGYSCVYTSNISWRSESSPVAKEIDPASVFDRLFEGKDKRQNGDVQDKRKRYKKSILDFVLEDAKSLSLKLGTSDRKKLDEYLFAVRDIERRITGADKLTDAEEGVPDYPRPAGVPREFEEHLRLLSDLIVLAFQTDSTRISTFMYANAGSNRSYSQVGVSDGHHGISHHGNDKGKLEKIAKINGYHIQQLAYLTERLASVKEGEGTLLDNCMLMYGSGLADGNRHAHHDLPIVLLGGGGGTINSGRHVRYKEETPLTNLYVSMLNRVGAKTESMADSTGPLKDLS
ncbi:MAG: hypothetical protein ACI9G1_004115 [Pirellulaceae bacterium]|jgi:hypothetical protein